MSSAQAELLPPLDVIYPASELRSTSVFTRRSLLHVTKATELYWESAGNLPVPQGRLCKYWDVHKDWPGFFTEAFIMSSVSHLRALQSITIPRIVNLIATHEGFINIVMEPPNGTKTGWTEAHPVDTPFDVKSKIIQAFETFHSIGVLHGHIELRQILITDEDQICVIDWDKAKTLSAISSAGIGICTPSQLDEEMTRLRLLLDFDDARQETSISLGLVPSPTGMLFPVDQTSGENPEVADSIHNAGASRAARSGRRIPWIDEDGDGPPWARRVDLLSLCNVAQSTRDEHRPSAPSSNRAHSELPGLLELTASYQPLLTPNQISLFTEEPLGSQDVQGTLPQSPPSSPPTRAQRAASLKQELAELDRELAAAQLRRRQIVNALEILAPPDPRARLRKRSRAFVASDAAAANAEAVSTANMPKATGGKRKRTFAESDEAEKAPRSSKRSKP